MRKVCVKEKVCIGCHLCEVYCQLQHSQSKDIIKAFKMEPSRPFPRLQVEGKGVVSFSVRCQQCYEVPCFYACLAGAIARDSMTGVIKVDPNETLVHVEAQDGSPNAEIKVKRFKEYGSPIASIN